ncbi:MAG: hypothetical protein JSR77_18365 [Planctomycetes bacterium]|nr:hypothetical protein [Planctomycetota bacterium]
MKGAFTSAADPWTYRVALFKQAVGLGSVSPGSRRFISRPKYTLEAALSEGSHTLTFRSGLHVITELVLPNSAPLPPGKKLGGGVCQLGHDVESHAEDGTCRHLGSLSSEQLDTHAFWAAFGEIADLALEHDAFVMRWGDGIARSMSVLDVQSFMNEVHVQGYHFDASCHLIIRSQSIFEHVSARSGVLGGGMHIDGSRAGVICSRSELRMADPNESRIQVGRVRPRKSPKR